MPPKLLSGRLKFLIENGLVAREVDSGYPPRSEYVLTQRGRSLFPIVKTLGDWGLANLYEGEENVTEEIAAIVSAAVPEFTE